MSEEDVRATVRRAYAKQMLAIAGIAQDPRLEDAFAAVRRENFVGPPPWKVSSQRGYVDFPSSDAVTIYQDINIALAGDRGVNNGSPSLHARWLHAAGLQPGARVVHIGAGTGYYTALIAHLVGLNGHVTAVEFDSALAARARQNLSHLAQVEVIECDGEQWPREPVDCVYVNFATSRPAEPWVEKLSPGGKLIFPLGVPRPSRSGAGGFHTLYGAGVSVERQKEGFSAHFLGPASFVWAEGTLSSGEHEGLAISFQRGGIEFIQSLRWKQPCVPDRCWHIGQGWGLSYETLDATPQP